MRISSRTPEGRPNRCEICGNELQIEPSANGANPADAPCPHCGSLLWFAAQAQWRDSTGEVKAGIRNWVQYIQQLSHLQTDADAYHQEVLQGLITSLAARGGVIWRRDTHGFQIQYGLGLEVIARPSLLEAPHQRLLERVFAEGGPMVMQPGEAGRDGANPTDTLLLLGLVKRHSTPIALVEIFQRAGSSATVQRGYLRFLQQICDLASAGATIREERDDA